MAETPKKIEINVVYGAQLRAVVRSVLMHVKNKLEEEFSGRTDVDAETRADMQHVVDKELAKWPLVHTHDALPQWIYERFAKHELVVNWDQLTDNDRDYYRHEAEAVRRAVGRS